MSTESNSKGSRSRSKSSSARGASSGFSLRNVRVGTLLLLVMALFFVLVASVGGMAAYFLQENYKSVQAVGELTARAREVATINSDMLRARVGLMVAARYYQEAGWGGGDAATASAKKSMDEAVATLDGVRSHFNDFQKNMLEDDA
ncbi:MAG TPA: Tar ligand binding domain-containing protein, partial [Bordetella sp.]